ncbi:MAG: nicotinate-nucleotide adenylyltransferase, partial [Candidatus Marinamargulisbacteria bacterium]
MSISLLFGGSFDPFHLGHLHMIQAATSISGINEVVMIPNFRSPQKEMPVAGSDHRHAMLELI